MKKNCILIVSFLLTIAVIPHVLLADKGIKGGIVISDLAFSEESGDDWEPYRRYQVGMFFSFSILNHVELQPELYFVMKGARATGMIGDEEISIKMQLNYVEVPLLFKFIPTDKWKIQPAVFAGVYVGYNIDAKSVAHYAGETEEVDMNASMKNFDYGFVAGVGISWRSGIGKLVLDLRYCRSLGSIYKSMYGDRSAKNKGFAFMLGISL